MIISPFSHSARARFMYILKTRVAAKDALKQLLEMDPNRMDIVDMYSNILYVKEDKVGLTHLAHHAVEVCLDIAIKIMMYNVFVYCTLYRVHYNCECTLHFHCTL